MRVIPPLTITDSILTSSSIPETAPAVYNSGTTYAIDVQVSVAGASNLFSVYQSLANDNTGHAPASSPTWWQLIGDVYGNYSSAITYTLGQRVNNPTTHNVYELIVASSLNFPTSDTTKWLEIGPNNRWSMFDYKHGGKSVTGNTQTIVLTPGTRVDSLALINIEATSVNISMTAPGYSGEPTRVVNSWYTYLFSPFVSADEVYNQTIELSTRLVTDLYTYFYNPFGYKNRVAVFDLPPITSAIITVTLSNEEGNVTLGNLVLGFGVYLGGVQYTVENDSLNFSTINRSFDGGLTDLVQRRNVTKINGQSFIDSTLVNTVKRIRDDLNAVPAIWAGIEDITQDYYESLFILGLIRKFSINLAYPETSVINFEIEEI